jgi:hypothetical protein
MVGLQPGHRQCPLVASCLNLLPSLGDDSMVYWGQTGWRELEYGTELLSSEISVK